MPERPDFPYYAGQPVLLDGRSWLILMAALTLALVVLAMLPLRDVPQSLIPALLFVAIPLAALRLVAGPCWTALFRRVGLRQIGQMALFAVLTLAGSIGMGLVLSEAFTLSPNRVSESIGATTGVGLVARLVPTIPQLVGEELLGILPFLALLWLCVTRLRLSRRVGIAVALVGSALIFGAAHLPTYDWNWAQALLGIGTARLFLTLAYIASRNLWVSAGAHVLNDWAGFLFAFAAGHAPIGAGN